MHLYEKITSPTQTNECLTEVPEGLVFLRKFELFLTFFSVRHFIIHFSSLSCHTFLAISFLSGKSKLHALSGFGSFHPNSEIGDQTLVLLADLSCWEGKRKLLALSICTAIPLTARKAIAAYQSSPVVPNLHWDATRLRRVGAQLGPPSAVTMALPWFAAATTPTTKLR